MLNNLNDLVNLGGLTRLGAIGNSLSITNNDNLTSITNLGRLGVNGAESGGRATYDVATLRIANNPDLTKH